MSKLPDVFITLVRRMSHIEEIARNEFGMVLNRVDGGKFVGICHLCHGRLPSLEITPASRMWYCFACCQGGDVIAFVREHEHVSFPAAVEWLAQYQLKVLDDWAEMANAL